MLQEASVFFKKRAVLEEEFGRGMFKLAKNTAEVYAMNDGKAGYAAKSFSTPLHSNLLPFPFPRPVLSLYSMGISAIVTNLQL